MVKIIKKDKFVWVVILFLIVGVLYKLLITSGGNFIFNIDNARDLVDVREMMITKKIRLVANTTGIEGVFNGPAWYYLLSIPFTLGNGNPYSAIILMIVLWTIGGFFLCLLLKKYGVLAVIVGGSIWVASNYVNLATVYAFNPNPLLLLMPAFVYFFVRFLETKKLIFSILSFFLAGIFFNCEMAFGAFLPVVILLTLILTKNLSLLKSKNLWIGSLFFILFVIPQVLFEIKHNFFMTSSLINYLNNNSSSGGHKLMERFKTNWEVYYGGFSGVLMNWDLLNKCAILAVLILTLLIFVKKELRKDLTLIITLLLISVPFVLFTIAPMVLYSWHITGSMASIVLIMGISVYFVDQFFKKFRLPGILITLLIVFFSINNLELPKNLFQTRDNKDPSNFKNELSAVDYVYQKAQGKNFKAYTYLPSVIDYPYQYIFWWRGNNKYGYLPEDYAYLPNKPSYIGGKEKLISKNNPPSSNLVFLIKEPDRIGLRHLWQNSFNNLEPVSKEMVGPLEIEIKRNSSKP